MWVLPPRPAPHPPPRRYGGVAYREAVAQAADWYTFRVADITAALQQQQQQQ